MTLEVVKIPPTKNKHTKLCKQDAYVMEVEALCRLQNTYQCICNYETSDGNTLTDGNKKVHFPKIIRTDSKIGKMVMSHCGKSLNDPETRRKVIEYSKTNIEDLRKQAYCIVHNMILSGVKHVDCPTTGQNICWDGESNTLSLIDFDICHIRNTHSGNNKVINSWKNSYGKTDKEYAMNFFRQIMYIVRYEK